MALMALASCTVRGDAQSVIAWGNNSSGQTNVPASATNVIAVAAGGFHSLALSSDGTVISWGAITNVPSNLINVQAIVAGASHSAALQAGGSVVAWGNNSFSQTNVPISATNVVALAAGHYHTVALRGDGTVVAWGRNSSGQINVPTGLDCVVAVAAGAEHSVALRNDGSMVNWGRKFVPPNSLRNAQALAAGAMQTLAVRADGRIASWGNFDLTLSVPRSATNMVAIAAGTNFNLTLSDSGEISAWGSGIVTNVPASATNIIAIAAGHGHGLAIQGDGSPRILGSVAYQSSGSVGSPLPLSARTVSSTPLDFQWFVGGTLTGANSRAPSIPALLGNDQVVCHVVVSNAFGVVTSAVATLTVRPLSVWGDNRNRQCFIPPDVTRPVLIAAGGFHNLALQPNGALVSWGKNSDGQTNVPPTATNIVALAGGSDHSLALRNDGSVVAWGRNTDGQTNVPPSATNVVAIAAGWAHSAALKADGSVVAWGNNDYQQSSASFLATDVMAIACGYYHTLVLRADRTVVSWGLFDSVPEQATNVTAIAAGFEHSMALRADGTVVAWGDNTFGQGTVPSSATNVVAIAAGWYQSAALRADGTLVTWGKSHSKSATDAPISLSNVVSFAVGEDFSSALVGLGPPEFSPQLKSTVTYVGGLAVLNVGVQGTHPLSYQWFHDGTPVSVATNQTLVLSNIQPSQAGQYYLVVSNQFGLATNQAVALTVSSNPATIRRVGAWGENVNGQCNIPANITNPRALAAGRGHCLALQANRTVVAWGDNTHGQTNIPANVSNIVAIAAGGRHSLALHTNGYVFAWGDGLSGQTWVPPSANNVVAIAAGMDHSVALRRDGSVVVWGNNAFINQTNVPPLYQRAIAIAAGYYHTLVLLSNRTVVAWGSTLAVPSTVTNVIAIAGGFNHSLAVRADGTVVAWGDNTHGQTDVPVSATNVVGVAAGFYHSIALRSDGTVVAWGTGYFGSTTVPTGLGNVAGIAARENYCLALVETGPPSVASQPIQTTVHVGSPAFLIADFAGTQPFAGQWFRDGSPVEGATNVFLWLPDVQVGDAGNYTFFATNRLGESGDSLMQLTVSEAPFISTTTTRKTVPPRGSICLQAQAFGSAPLDYQWRHNNQDLTDDGRISGAMTESLCLTDANYADAGEYHLLVTNPSGASTGLVAQLVVSPVIAWGKNFSSQTDVPMSASHAVSISAGGDTSVGLKPDGTVSIWGDQQVIVPAKATNIISVAQGGSHTVALRADGTVVAWGDNGSSQTNVPVGATGVIAVAAGLANSLALRTNGSVMAWGYRGQFVPSSPAVAIAGGDGYWMTLSTNGTVVSSGATTPPMESNIVAIAAGDFHGVALRSDGEVIAWGDNSVNQTNVPPDATNVVAIAAGGDHSLALRADGIVIAWGENDYGESDVPLTATNIVSIAAGANHSLALHGGANRSHVQQPPRVSVLGGNALFMINATGVRGTIYQWQLNEKNIAGATNAFLVVNVGHWTNSGTYRVVVSNLFGTTLSEPVVLTVTRTPLRFDTSTISNSTNRFQARVLGASGVGPVVVYASTNLEFWSPVFTNPPVIGAVDFSEAINLDLPGTMYRAAELTTPSSLSLEMMLPEFQNNDVALPLRVTGLSAVGPVTIFASSNLFDWQGIFTNPPTMGPLEFWDSPAPNQPLRFYRVGEARP